MNLPLIKANTCRLCKFATPVNPQQLQCRRYPKQVTILPIPTGPNQARLEPLAAYPLMSPDEDCGEFKPKIEI